MATTYDILQAKAIFPETVVDRVTFTYQFDDNFGGGNRWQTQNGIRQPFQSQVFLDNGIAETINNVEQANQIRLIANAPQQGIYRINHLAIHAYLRGGLKIVMWHGNDTTQVRFHELNPEGVLGVSLAAGPVNTIVNATEAQETTKFTIFSKEEPFYLLSDKSLYVGLEGSGNRGETYSLSYVCSYEVLTF